MTVKVYVSEECPVCEGLKDQLAALAGTNPDVEVVSIDSDVGFDQFVGDGADAVPTAYCEGKPCKILRGEEKIAIKCGDRLIGATPDEVDD